jgi:hypothetical protein
MKRRYGVDLIRDVELDKYALDEEAEMNSSILQYWGELNAESRTALYKVEGELKTLKAQKDLFYRRNPPADIKVTESVIASLVEVDEEVLEKKDEVYEWTEKANRYFAAVDAIHDKGNRINNLKDLWEKGYYSNKN